eukprot:CAMPEP_0183341690 /NCGR_PEP_ID=MMETSP0164_2-20130417/7937_1 /TAXON_ID=221442 /ORGANISM="Coccolithus pelagicus ssp braarudi, Strain PLY182g" /LENGTH=53 /DNA_ID=CAMNT_0025512089 /DNA_START=197 /DNA_END=355 /DNA_ORIENTATION=+
MCDQLQHTPVPLASVPPLHPPIPFRSTSHAPEIGIALQMARSRARAHACIRAV